MKERRWREETIEIIQEIHDLKPQYSQKLIKAVWYFALRVIKRKVSAGEKVYLNELGTLKLEKTGYLDYVKPVFKPAQRWRNEINQARKSDGITDENIGMEEDYAEFE